MKKIEAIIRKTKFEDVKDALLDADIERLPTHPDCVTDEEDRLMRRIAREVLL